MWDENILGGIKGRLDIEEENISEFEDITVKTSLEKCLTLSYRVKNTLTILLIGIYPREMKSCPIKDTYVICNLKYLFVASNCGKQQISISQWMDRQIVLYSYNGMLFSNKRNRLSLHVTVWKNLKQCILNESRILKVYSEIPFI